MRDVASGVPAHGAREASEGVLDFQELPQNGHLLFNAKRALQRFFAMSFLSHFTAEAADRKVFLG
jgi:hypothetical protein